MPDSDVSITLRMDLNADPPGWWLEVRSGEGYNEIAKHHVLPEDVLQIARMYDTNFSRRGMLPIFTAVSNASNEARRELHTTREQLCVAVSRLEAREAQLVRWDKALDGEQKEATADEPS